METTTCHGTNRIILSNRTRLVKMGTWYCDNEGCGKPFPARKGYVCDQLCEECSDPYGLGRAFCSKKCHDEAMK